MLCLYIHVREESGKMMKLAAKRRHLESLPFAVATSPSGWATQCAALGETPMGKSTCSPSSCVLMFTLDTSLRTRGRRRYLGRSEHNVVCKKADFLCTMYMYIPIHVYTNVTALGVLCYFALFVCLTLLASIFLPSHLSFKNMYIPGTKTVL